MQKFSIRESVFFIGFLFSESTYIEDYNNRLLYRYFWSLSPKNAFRKKVNYNKT